MKKVWERRSHTFPSHYTSALMCSAPSKSIFCCANFGATNALDLQQKSLSYFLLKNKWHCNLFLEFIALLCSSEVPFVKFPRFLAFLVGLFFGYIHFHAGPCYRPQKYRLAVDLIACT